MISRNVRVDSIDPKANIASPLKLGQPSESLTQILGLLRHHADGKALLASSMKGFMDSVSGLNISKQVCHMQIVYHLKLGLIFNEILRAGSWIATDGVRMNPLADLHDVTA